MKIYIVIPIGVKAVFKKILAQCLKLISPVKKRLLDDYVVYFFKLYIFAPSFITIKKGKQTQIDN
jgi:hypothetical protein